MTPSYLVDSNLETPFLWVDLDIMERNISCLAKYFNQAGVNWRPHIKGIKIPDIAKAAIDKGAVGITCAKLSEAEVMVSAGIKEILIANQIVDPVKISRLAELNKQAEIMVAVDNPKNIEDLSDIAQEKDGRINVLIEMNIGMNRCGVLSPETALKLAEQINNSRGTQLRGIMGWEGHVVGIADFQQKKESCLKAATSLVDTSRLLKEEGHDISIVSCGGSGSYTITSHIPGVTEIQAGGAILGDITYNHWGVETHNALFIQASVISRPSADRAIIDAGFKTMSKDVFIPELVEHPGVQLVDLDAEHGYLKIDDPQNKLALGDRLNFIVGYGDSTTFLHDRLIGTRNGSVDNIWKIEARGKLT